jgi:hypothetical protein
VTTKRVKKNEKIYATASLTTSCHPSFAGFFEISITILIQSIFEEKN